MGTQFLRTFKILPGDYYHSLEQYALEDLNWTLLTMLLKPIPFDRLLKGLIKQGTVYLRKQSVEGNEEAFSLFRAEYKEIKIFLRIYYTLKT